MVEFLRIRKPDGTVDGDGVFEVHQAQADFICGSSRRNQLFLGGRGAGKTHALVLKALFLALSNPCCDGVIAGRTFKESGTRLKRYWDKAVDKWEAATGERLVHSHSKSLQRTRLVNDSYVWFKGYDQVDKIRGDDIAWIVLDELEFSSADPRYVWDVLNPSVRQPGAKLLQVACSTTPNGVGGISGHFYRQQQIQRRPGEHTAAEVRNASRYYVVRAKMMDNPWLLPEVKEQIAGSVSGRMYKQEVLGMILSPDDAVFSEFSFEKHVIDWRWQKKLPYIFGIDWGTSHAYYCAIQIVDRPGFGVPVGSWVVARELKAEHTSYGEFRRKIVDFAEAVGRKPRAAAADRALKTENAWFRARFGVDCFTLQRKNEQDVINGVELVRYMLDPHEDKPRLYFSRQGLSTDVVNEEGRGILGSLVNYQYAKDRFGVLTNVPLKDNICDHPCDALRYACVSTRMFSEFHGGQPLPYVFPERVKVADSL